MNENQTAQKKFSDRFIPEIKRILGEFLIVTAPFVEDTEHNSDLIALSMESVRIACRVRTFSYIIYPDDFTIRSKLPSGFRTEIDKVMEGWGTYLFYGISNEPATVLENWKIISLNELRNLISTYMRDNLGSYPGTRKVNADKTEFLAFNTRVYPNLVVKQSKPAIRQPLQQTFNTVGW